MVQNSGSQIDRTEVCLSKYFLWRITWWPRALVVCYDRLKDCLRMNCTRDGKVKMNTIYIIVIPTLKCETSRGLLAVPRSSSSALFRALRNKPHCDNFHASNASTSSSPSLSCQGLSDPPHQDGHRLHDIIETNVATDHKTGWQVKTCLLLVVMG